MSSRSRAREAGDAFRRAGLPLALVVGLLVVTALIAAWLFAESHQRASTIQEDAAIQAAQRIDAQSSAQRSSLAVLSASLAQGGDVTAERFQELSEAPLRAGLSEVSWLPRVSAAERARFERGLQSPILQLEEGRSAGVAGRRSVYFPSIAPARLGAPADGAVGVDHWSEPQLRAALQRARDSAQAAAAGPARLAEGPRAVVTYQPVYRGGVDPGGQAGRRAALIGFVAGSLERDRLTEIAAAGAPRDARVEVAFAEDGGSGSDTVDIAGVPINVEVTGLRGSLVAPGIVLLTGLGVAALVGLLFLLAAAREREGRRSSEMVRRERDRSRAVVSAIQDGLVVLGETLAIETVNARFAEIVGMEESDLIGSEPPFAFLIESESDRLFEILEEVAVLGVGEFELTLSNSDGDEVPAILSVAKRADPGRRTAGYVCTVKDITARKRAEGHLRERDAENRALAAQQAALRTVATAVAREIDPDAVFKLVAREARSLTAGDIGGVARFSGGRKSGVVVAWSSEDDRVVPSRLALSDRESESDDPLRATILGSRRTDQPIASVAAPIRSGSEIWGVVFVETTSSDLVPRHAESGIEGLAELASLAIANDDARRRLESAASTDPLTGLANRRTFDERLRHEVSRSLRGGQQLSLVLADIDHFKMVNDTHGHQAGDQVLVEVASRLTELARVGDLVARVGGEEFAWILTETDARGALTAAERARLAIRERDFPDVGSLTISLGVATASAGADAERLVGQADAALYWAKQHGRDQSGAWSPEIGADPSQRGRRTGVARARAQDGLHSLVRGIEEETDPGAIPRSDRVAQLAAAIAERCGWTDADAARLHEAALLHDVGWVAVPAKLRVRRGSLEDEDLAKIRLHADVGATISGEVLDEDQVSWIRHHHEHWDGGGYPGRLVGELIPEGARILALADAWVAMTSPRDYRPRLGDERALAECRAQAGTQFWPVAVHALEQIMQGREEEVATLLARS
ncbi:MAG: diguanylate cyclase [Thermoleophilia bacterium]|nr:diguanylate cyclase [Thermoleophilia bacterium]MDH3724439.1 diguanylate cyclase [Thermoleophilia bacterium]